MWIRFYDIITNTAWQQGMVDPGERVSVTLKQEFLEEALDVANMTEEVEQQCREQVNALFQGGNEVHCIKQK